MHIGEAEDLERKRSPDQSQLLHCSQIVSLLNTLHAIGHPAFDQKRPTTEESRIRENEEEEEEEE